MEGNTAKECKDFQEKSKVNPLEQPHKIRADAKIPLLSRRALLIGGAGAIGMVALGGVGAVFAGEQNILRPPGGQDEELLRGACIKCDRCRSACLHSAVDLAHLEEGFVNARTPKMGYRKGYCDFCEGLSSYRCVDSCPTGALVSGFSPVDDKIGIARVDTAECLLYRSGSGRCSKQCIVACIFEAIDIDGAGNLVVNEAACNGCGACEYMCPSSSYGSYTGSGRRGVNVETWSREHSYE